MHSSLKNYLIVVALIYFVKRIEYFVDAFQSPGLVEKLRKIIGKDP